jgi:hypothetical protein
MIHRALAEPKVAAASIGLFALAFSIRVIGVDYGYFHGDERVNDAAKVLTGQLVPTQHFYPPLINYLTAVAFGVLYAAGLALGTWADTAAFRAQYFEDPTVFYVAARGTTAALGAVIAPLFFLTARSLRLGWTQALAAGALGVLIPIAIYQSHIAKGDVPLATATVLVIYLLLRRHQDGATFRHDIALGASAALALSFKQSFVFLLLPLIAAHCWQLSRNGAGVARPLAFSLAGGAIVWPILNLGIVLDFQRFLAYQRVQSAMSVADGPITESVQTWAEMGASLVQGITPIGFALALAFPLILYSKHSHLPQRSLLTGIWAALLLSTLMILGVVGNRQPEHLWLPQFAGMHLLSALVIGDLMRRGWIGPMLWATTAGMSVYGAIVISLQALAPPLRDDLQALLLRDYSDRRILTGVTLTLPQSPEAMVEDKARLQRLAAKYNVTLPDEAPERATHRTSSSGLYYRPTPPVMYGLEDKSDSDVLGAVQAHAWPLQPEEWQLDHWLEQGFDLFVVSDLEYALHRTPAKLFRGFWSDVASRCATVAELEPRKPLFLERSVTLLDCAERR